MSNKIDLHIHSTASDGTDSITDHDTIVGSQLMENPCKFSTDRIDADIAIKAIIHAGGIPVWAHPLGGEGERRLTAEEFDTQLTALISYGIQGLECFYSR